MQLANVVGACCATAAADCTIVDPVAPHRVTASSEGITIFFLDERDNFAGFEVRNILLR